MPYSGLKPNPPAKTLYPLLNQVDVHITDLTTIWRQKSAEAKRCNAKQSNGRSKISLSLPLSILHARTHVHTLLNMFQLCSCVQLHKHARVRIIQPLDLKRPKCTKKAQKTQRQCTFTIDIFLKKNTSSC